MVVSVLIFIVVLSVLVLVHELGHFLVAKRSGILVEEFGLGIPPRIYGKKIGDTIYSINLLPFGGFVRLHGEQGDGPIANPSKAFLNKGKLTRTLVIVSGVVMNFLLAVVAFTIFYWFTGIPRDTHRVTIIDISPGSPAVTAGLKPGDVIESVNGKTFTNINDFITYVDSEAGKKIAIQTQNGTVEVTPRLNPPSGEGPLGVVISTTEVYFPPIWQRPFYGVYYGFRDALFWGGTIISGLRSIFVQIFAGQAPQGVSGPVGIFAVTTEAASLGVLTLINFVGILSVNLAILNIVPFPALDGGRLLFIGIEAVTKKKVSPKVEAAIHTAGMAILLALILLITIGDIRRLVTVKGNISGFINSVTNQ